MPDAAPETRAATEPRPGLIRRALDLVAETFDRFAADDIPRSAAAISYYALLALAPTLLIVNALVVAAGSRLPSGPGAGALGEGSATASAYFQQISAWAGGWAPVVMLVLIVMGALSVFTQFIWAMQRIWQLPAAEQPIRDLVRSNLLSLLLLGAATLAFAAAVLVVAVVTIFGQLALSYLAALGVAVPGLAVSFAVRAGLVYLTAALFFLVAFRLVPRRGTKWRDVVGGTLVTALLFLLGEWGLSIYLSTTRQFSVFGTFQFFVVLIVWIYYTSLVVLWGAEFTRLTVLAAETRRAADAS